MSKPRKKTTLGSVIYFATAFMLALYFTFAAVQGESGLFRRAQIDARITTLRTTLATLDQDVARMENKTRRLSDAYLDVDLLDEQARSVLGLARSDEIVIR